MNETTVSESRCRDVRSDDGINNTPSGRHLPCYKYLSRAGFPKLAELSPETENTITWYTNYAQSSLSGFRPILQGLTVERNKMPGFEGGKKKNSIRICNILPKFIFSLWWLKETVYEALSLWILNLLPHQPIMYYLFMNSFKSNFIVLKYHNDALQAINIFRKREAKNCFPKYKFGYIPSQISYALLQLYKSILEKYL